MFERFLVLFADFDFLDIVFYFFCFLFSIISFIRTGRSSKNIKKILEVYDEMKYRLSNYRETDESPSQSFETEVDQFRLNKSTNELEKLPDKLDIQQLVQSCEDLALPNMLQHLEPVTQLDEVVDAHNDALDKLDYMREADAFRLEMCTKYCLDPRTSFNDVISYLSTEEKVLRGKIGVLSRDEEKALHGKLGVLKNDKEVSVNEKTSVDET